MKEVIVIIRPGRAKITKQKLAGKGFFSYTEEKVLGHGKQGGLGYMQGGSDSHCKAGIPFLPKRMLTIFVNDEAIDSVTAVLVEANRTGEIGDGRIFICPVEDTLRIRTDERKKTAL